MSDEAATGESAAQDEAERVGSAAASRRVPTSLYGWLWSRLPEGRALRVILVVLAVIAVVVVLFGWVFPWLEPRLPWVDVTVGAGGAGG